MPPYPGSVVRMCRTETVTSACMCGVTQAIAFVCGARLPRCGDSDALLYRRTAACLDAMILMVQATPVVCHPITQTFLLLSPHFCYRLVLGDYATREPSGTFF